MGLGSYGRFIIGLILSLEMIRSWFSDRQITTLAITLASIFIVLSVMFFVKRV